MLPTPMPTLTPKMETPGADFASDIILLMRAINARQQAVGLLQSDWGLEDTPDGGKEFPSLDALDDVQDLTPFVQALQDAVGQAPLYTCNRGKVPARDSLAYTAAVFPRGGD